MGRYLVGVVLWVGALVQAAAAQRSVQVKVAATEPASEATLGRDQSFYVRIEYTSDEPVKLWARPFLRGTEAPAMSNPSREYVGSGYALGWFAFREPAEVDEIRIEAGGGKPYREWVVASYPVKLRWTADAAEPRGAAPWVAQLRAEDAAAERAAMQARMNEPVSTGDFALMQGFMLAVLGAVLGGIIAPIWAFRKWRGGWRIAAAAPLLLVLFAIARIVLGTAIDPTSHNLWPFELGMFALAALAIIGVLALGRRLVGATRG